MSSSRITSAVAAALLAASILALSGCGQTAPPASTMAAPVRPAAPNLTTPESAVRSYLAWTTYAYRVANSDIATPTMSPDEEVRVNSYVELNNEKQRVINQVLNSVEFGKASVVGTTTVIPTKENWQYSYLSRADQQSISPTYPVSYEATYTVIRTGKSTWVVDSVAAKAHGEVH